MILKKGTRGKEVKQLQEYLEIGADGVFGPGTEAAVKKWQKENSFSRQTVSLVLKHGKPWD
jgi:peptidoglycan hydrolase-like protein with peptidoglycan-binding domain